MISKAQRPPRIQLSARLARCRYRWVAWTHHTHSSTAPFGHRAYARLSDLSLNDLLGMPVLQYTVSEAGMKLPQLVSFLKVRRGHLNSMQLCPPLPAQCALPMLARFGLPTLLLQEHAAEKTIVYFLTCACVDFASGRFGLHVRWLCLSC